MHLTNKDFPFCSSKQVRLQLQRNMSKLSDKAQLVREIFKNPRRNFPRRKVVLKGLFDLMQVDLMEMGQISKENDDARYVLCAINCFSKLAFCRTLKNKKSSTTAIAMEEILDE